MNSFNAFGQTEKTIGGNTPVWLGTVKPVPAGAVMNHPQKTLISAGTPVKYDAALKVVEYDAELNQCNAYLYNDVYNEEATFSSVAVVMYHPEGLLIERVGKEISEEDIATLQANIPGVLLVRG